MSGDEEKEKADPMAVLEGLLEGEDLAELRGRMASRLLRKKLGQ
jgi:hypothetical protein